ncbi:MAG: cysteate synthase [Bacteroidetes bacterium 4572_77]|nr:MAG: cysteate synthase [Bacteroidetes bacterium 4572_77]
MNINIEETNYKLMSVASGHIFNDQGWTLDAPEEKQASLVRALYDSKKLIVKSKEYGIYKFADWLPIHKTLKGSYAPITFKSTKLAKHLGLSNLHITFSGYWPERDIKMRTCSFKETEAFTVCSRIPNTEKRILVVASAGNTARAFAQVCSDNEIPLLLSVPEDNLNALWFDAPLNDCVKLIASKTGGDYFDAIHLSNLACEMPEFFAEGGAKNVARRDGMATTMLSAATSIGQIPDYYFQAIGSGTGAIAAWEANLRLIEDGNYGANKAKLMVSQNYPFHPIADAWNVRSRALLDFNHQEARKQVEIIDAKVLSNRKPPYPIIGGLFDAMQDTGGEVLIATNEQARKAAQLFIETEGIDIHPAAAVALATLIESVENNKIDKKSIIMLNITGGGESRFKEEHELFYLKPQIIFDIDVQAPQVEAKLKDLKW